MQGISLIRLAFGQRCYDSDVVRKDTSSLVDRPTLFGETTITGRGQVTLPARGLRAMEWKTGDHLLVQRLGADMVLLMRRPTNWAKEFAGKLTHVFGDHEA